MDEAKVRFARIDQWESGEAGPTYPQLEQLSELFKIPIAVFFFPEPPDLPPISETFRTLPEADFDSIPRQVRQLLRKAKSFQLSLAELCEGENPAHSQIAQDLEISFSSPVSQSAQEVRDYLDVSLEEQFSWRSSDEALKNWRTRLQSVGVFVFKDAFYESEYSGFCLYDTVFPIIYVNNSNSKTRQSFTLFHELAHLLLETSGIDTINDHFIPNLPAQAQQIEVFCNQFAAEFLVPDSAFDPIAHEMERSERSAELLADKFNVSRELIFRKFLDRGWINPASYEAAAERWSSQRRAGTGGNYYNTQIAYLGREYIGLALSQYHRNRISETELADHLGFKPKYLENLEEAYNRGEA